MKKLKQYMPVLFSPTFWGLTFSAIFQVVAYMGWLDQTVMNILTTWLASVTGVNIVWKAAKKTAGQ